MFSCGLLIDCSLCFSLWIIILCCGLWIVLKSTLLWLLQLVRCAEPDCPPGSELTRDDIRCCPYCVTQTGMLVGIQHPVFHSTSCTHAVECRRDEMQCFTGECISQSLTCDSLRDCPNREDEDNCDG